MEQPPSPSASEPPERDLPKPPIWDRPTGDTPPIDIPRVGPASGQISSGQTSERPPIVPPAPSGPTFTGHIYPTVPASGAGIVDRPSWPTAPPTAGATVLDTPAEPQRRSRKRLGLIAAAVLVAAAVAIGGFFFGRSVASSEAATTPIAAPTVEVPTADTIPDVPTTAPEATTPPATTVPAPTPEPSLPPVNDAPSPVLPGEGADEPVAAVAQAVAPAVVLIQNEFGQGSGIIYDDAGLILTNAHVVGASTQVQVTLASGVKVPGEVIGADVLTDVAVVSIDTDFEFGVAVLAPQSSIQVGQLAVAIGSPFGLEQTVTSGIVSAKGRVIENFTTDGRRSIVAMIQTDAPINPGNSGGALADRQGRVIGMNTSIRTDGSGGSIGVGFAVPADTAETIAQRIIAGESLDQGFLGIDGGTPLVGEPGVVISEVTPGSGAEAAGLASGDLITGFNGGVIRNMGDLAAAVRLQPPNATVSVEFERGGETQTVEVTLGLLTEQ